MAILFCVSLCLTSCSSNNKKEKDDVISLDFSFDGTIGESPAKIQFDGNNGTYTYLYNPKKDIWADRTIQMGEWNANTKELKLTGNDKKGEYIGEFSGTYDGSSYSGTFTNYKGVTIAFNFNIPSVYNSAAEPSTSQSDISQDKYPSSDLRTFDLYGSVEFVEYIYEVYNDEYDDFYRDITSTSKFTDTGELISYLEGYYYSSVSRDNQGRILRLETEENDGSPLACGIAFHYNTDGRVDSLFTWMESTCNNHYYKYDSEKKIISATQETDHDQENVHYSVSYRNYERDHHDNWISREAEYVRTSFKNYFGAEECYSPEKKYVKERRKITYYGEASHSVKSAAPSPSNSNPSSTYNSASEEERLMNEWNAAFDEMSNLQNDVYLELLTNGQRKTPSTNQKMRQLEKAFDRYKSASRKYSDFQRRNGRGFDANVTDDLFNKHQNNLLKFVTNYNRL